MPPPSALESAALPVESRPTTPARCVLLVPDAVASVRADASSPAPAPGVQPKEVEDESADPVGDGHSDADLARRLNDAPLPPAVPEPEMDERADPQADEKKGRSAAP